MTHTISSGRMPLTRPLRAATLVAITLWVYPRSFTVPQHRATNLRQRPALNSSPGDSGFEARSNPSTSLASSYVIHASNPGLNEFVWALSPLPEADEKHGVGAVASMALKSSTRKEEAAHTLACKVDEASSEMSVTIASTRENDPFLLDVLARVLVQWAAKRSDIGSSETSKISVMIEVPGSDSDNGFSLTASDLLTDNPQALFKTMLADDAVATEMSEMVDSTGQKLGAVPRPLVHKLNLLHRGIGMVVGKEQRVTQGMPSSSLPEIYCHQRADTKRIFPSLYDMFVGGVSTAGEDAKKTAAREVAEELGLERALEDPASDALAGPLFDCTVCTGYNRCVVSMFTYKCAAEEKVRLGADEVQWGGYVKYDVVEDAALLSINRLKERGEWPGSGDESDNELAPSDHLQNLEGADWSTWDFVPDGLLVWEAWVRWRKQVPAS